MICNGEITVYHNNGLDLTTHFETWERYNYNDAWFFGNENSSANKGYDNSHHFECRIPYEKNEGLNIDNFSAGDIILKGKIEIDITSQQDLSGYKIYNITGKTDNKYGMSQHIHLTGE